MDVALALFVVFISYVALVILRWAVKRHRRHNLFKRYGIPGPKPSFATGNMNQLKSGATPNDVVTAWLKEYGDVFGYFLGDMPFLVVKDLDMLKQVDITVDIVGKHAQKNEVFDMYELVQGLTLDVIAGCALAMETHCQENPQDIFLASVRDFFRYAQNRAVEYAIMFPFVASIMTFVSNYMTSGQMTNLIVDSVNSALTTRRQNPDFKSLDILQLMLDHSEEKIESGLTDEEIVANAYVFLLAGYETTATALAFTFYLLIKHPEIQEKLYKEIEKMEDSSYSSVQNLQYLDQVFSESLRYYPPVTGFISRRCHCDTKVGSITIPQEAVVLAPVWDIHHDPKLWPDPWKFDPDRFSSKNKLSLNSMAYIPFGIGRRNCIGARFAQLEAKLTIFRLLKRFKFEKCERTDDPLPLICPTVIINPANGICLRAVPRSAT
ncbi:cytochrome P450 3A41-like isoform X2 [Argiope bruennichi]|uniref:cytochrome P450 3A41-like isoform X2 n=1 Tax=Argiope bruennichi TaxID=94029 RepID=UPI0024942A65|nr:cytochrome P450 3A41-like isoform X2 [Argiope bruennichi]